MSTVESQSIEANRFAHIFKEKSLSASLKDCIACHTFNPKGQHLLGPNLYKIFDREIASLPDFEYSDTLKRTDGNWSRDTLNAFLINPHKILQKTTMLFKGIPKEYDRKILIDWLETYPLDLPINTLQEALNAGNPILGKFHIHPCLTCHTLIKQKESGIGPNLFGVVGRNVASVKGFYYSQDLIEHGGIWTPLRLNQFMMEIKKGGKSRHYAYKKLDTLQKRADLIAYLGTIR